jgi:hypothetical protein
MKDSKQAHIGSRSARKPDEVKDRFESYFEKDQGQLEKSEDSIYGKGS